MAKEYSTKAKSEIINYFEAHSDQKIAAKDIYEFLSASGKNINRATVYRNLDRLYEQGRLLRYREADSDCVYYQYSGEHDNCGNHLHAECSSCGKIFHLDDEFVYEFSKQLIDTYGLEVDFSRTFIMGKCKDCS